MIRKKWKFLLVKLLRLDKLLAGWAGQFLTCSRDPPFMYLEEWQMSKDGISLNVSVSGGSKLITEFCTGDGMCRELSGTRQYTSLSLCTLKPSPTLNHTQGSYSSPQKVVSLTTVSFTAHAPYWLNFSEGLWQTLLPPHSYPSFLSPSH
jgi:hypothetical protein